MWKSAGNYHNWLMTPSYQYDNNKSKSKGQRYGNYVRFEETTVGRQLDTWYMVAVATGKYLKYNPTNY